MGTIGLKQYITSLSFFVGQSALVQRKKQSNDDYEVATVNNTDNEDVGT
jgi:hypothetical protein